MKTDIAIVGMACIYPDADSPATLWNNILAGRRSFRAIPDSRLNAKDYLGKDGVFDDPNATITAALIDHYQFDRAHFMISKDQYEAADTAHWLALDVASRALDDAGYANGDGLSNETTGVLVGNTLTGDNSRTKIMRLRWPYVRRVVNEVLSQANVDDKDKRLEEIYNLYIKPFPESNEESLAGGLSNTIAGRICNFFNLQGGGYTLDGACSSSALAVINACTMLENDMDVVIAGGVDISIDPFEMIGFSRAGALAKKEMLVYDKQSQGMWPGEGCGFIVMMRLEDALAQKKRIYSVIKGWGLSTDGVGSITRPEIDGQKLVYRRAYEKAGMPMNSVGYFEGHGTGTTVGDECELTVISELIKESNSQHGQGIGRAAIGSVKANIGHCKAAAGIAGLIKASMACYHRILPPHVSVKDPHRLVSGDNEVLNVLPIGQQWQAGVTARAGISAMGFGGVNTHIVLEEFTSVKKPFVHKDHYKVNCVAGPQDAELVMFTAPSKENALTQLQKIQQLSLQMSYGELRDLAQNQYKDNNHKHPIKLACIVDTPKGLQAALAVLENWLRETTDNIFVDFERGLFGHCSASVKSDVKIGLLFPGQNAPIYDSGGAYQRRFNHLDQYYQTKNLKDQQGNRPCHDQARIVRASKVGMMLLDQLGVEGNVAIGHSLGELCACHWGGLMGEEALYSLVEKRAQSMFTHGEKNGVMLSVNATDEEVKSYLRDLNVVVAAKNSTKQIVVSGAANDVDKLQSKLAANEIRSTKLNVTHAFHSPLMQRASQDFATKIKDVQFNKGERCVGSTIVGRDIVATDDFKELFVDQFVNPICFDEIFQKHKSNIDLWIEVGPGSMLTNMVKYETEKANKQVVSLDIGSPTMAGLLKVAAFLFTHGHAKGLSSLFSGRVTALFELDHKHQFFESLCEQVATFDGAYLTDQDEGGDDVTEIMPQEKDYESTFALLQALVAEHIQLPVEVIKPSHKLLQDFHLSSIVISELLNKAINILGIKRTINTTEYVTSTLADIASGIDDVMKLSSDADGEQDVETIVGGIDSWVRYFGLHWVAITMPEWSEVTQVSIKKGFSGENGKQVTPMGKPFVHISDNSDTMIVSLSDVVCVADFDHLLASAQQAIADPEIKKVIVLQYESGTQGAGFAKCLSIEDNGLHVTVITLPHGIDDLSLIEAGCQCKARFLELKYGDNGMWYEAELALLNSDQNGYDLHLGESDVVLVTGGAKGITSECVMRMAQSYNCKYVIWGRSDPKKDDILAASLQRFKKCGLRFEYQIVDILHTSSVVLKIAEIEKRIGKITGFIHGAGTNIPELIVSTTDKSNYDDVINAKITCYLHLLNAFAPNQLKLLVGFSSIIGRIGLQGESAYAFANENMSLITETFKAKQTNCHCISIESTIWSGVGMGQRLGRVDILETIGVVPMTIDQGVDAFADLLSHKFDHVAIVLSGRTNDMHTIRHPEPVFEYSRFIETKLVAHKDIEFVFACALSLTSDPYMRNHVYQKQYLFPAVMSIEAMANVVVAFNGAQKGFCLKDIQLLKPIIVPERGHLSIRIAALKNKDGSISMAIRSEATQFLQDHVTANYVPSLPLSTQRHELATAWQGDQMNALDDASGLYGTLFFNQGSFKRINKYHQLASKQCWVEMIASDNKYWFSHFMPQKLVLGDPGTRDAAIHAIQACLPHKRLLPISVNTITTVGIENGVTHFVHAIERYYENDIYVYDVRLFNAQGVEIEKWEGLTLKVFEELDMCDMPIAVLNTYFKRKLQSLLQSDDFAIYLTDTDNEPSGGIHDYRGDGKPTLVSGRHISFSHTNGLTLSFESNQVVSCDIEAVVPRKTNVWEGMLGKSLPMALLLVKTSEMDMDESSTVTWSVMECLKKAGVPIETPVTFVSQEGFNWYVFKTAKAKIFTYCSRIDGVSQKIVFTFYEAALC